MRPVAVTLTVLALAAALLLMAATAVQSGNWPGWDEGWALIAFPLGVPVAVAAGIAASVRNGARPGVGRISLGATLAVWLWGAAIFAAWYALT